MANLQWSSESWTKNSISIIFNSNWHGVLRVYLFGLLWKMPIKAPKTSLSSRKFLTWNTIVDDDDDDGQCTNKCWDPWFFPLGFLMHLPWRPSISLFPCLLLPYLTVRRTGFQPSFHLLPFPLSNCYTTPATVYYHITKPFSRAVSRHPCVLVVGVLVAR